MPDAPARQLPPKWGAVFRTAGILAVPVLLAAGLLVWTGRADFLVAAALSGLAIVGLAVLAWLHVSDLRAVEVHLRALLEEAERGDSAAAGDSGEPADPPPETTSFVLGRVAGLGRQLATLYRRRSADLETARDELRAVAETIVDPLILVGRDRRVRLENRAARQRFGHALLERDLADGLRDPEVLAAADAVLAGGDAQTIVLHSLGSTDRVYEVRIAPFPRGKTAERLGALLSLHDITAAIRTEQMRADFVANASHELRNPISILSGCIETLQGAAKGDEAAGERFLKMMEAQTARMSRLTDDLLSLSQVEINELTPPGGSVDLRRVIGTVTDALRIKAGERSMDIVVDCPELPPIVGDSNQIEQVLINLIDNAIKYGAENTDCTVSARLRAQDDQIRGPVVDISVSDCGEGIAREHIPRLTERFYRVDKARSRAMGGTGLGLAIVKHIVARHQGRLAVRSSQDGDRTARGSTFTAILPVDLREA